ncbi:MAG TPA: TIGR03560 family F420-dependent LLM class oxidoreductase [Acidimicrobiales bacterium]|nr:TIGR03560 family F420-dependent LLM class oxidoreductase [Acidimicrobiales bacterium]
MRICLMVEGQEDVTWDQWVALARAAEDAGLEALFRSDHYLSVIGRTDRGSLDAWATLAGLAASTERIRLGTMVSPATFRHPSVLAKMVTTVDHVSGGRAELGMGAGWHEPEHRAYGFPFPLAQERLDVLEKQVEIVHRSWTERTFDFPGRHYTLEGLDALPKPVSRPHPNLIVGGSGGARSVAVAARWADEYNTVFASPEMAATRRALVDEAWERAGRDPAHLVFSVMTGCVVGRDNEELSSRARAVMAKRGDTGPDDAWLDERGEEWVVGTMDQAAERLGAMEEAGVQRVMLQHLAHEDVEMVALLGELAGRTG